MFPFPHTHWFLAAWNAMAVDQHVEKPELEKFADEGAEESGTEGRAEGVQSKRLVKKQESREICNHKRTITAEELANAQEITDLVDRMAADSRPSPEELDGMEESNEEEDEMPSDQEIIDLVDQMSDQSSSSFEELNGIEGSNEAEVEEPNDQEIIDLVDQMSDQNSSSSEELDGKERSKDEEDEMPSDQEIIDVVDQMSD
ncbi:protein MAK16 homolog isoform X1 [Orbicella faveolata]|uniref:protein MAK16 homolog isoform X1 n=1 Tax=Orbicella faveolata TaxID=48498 RepID=UPI0009E60163|nr:protein MAK16 homolog isoform X1 [Orbicella faveolata]XP_020625448.1 protein MAK16 homolog isoform X3 [Orbicella faveolata]XP_020625449.1 protein MAK16 homolog isoform X1 [Orbicella faveolata]